MTVWVALYGQRKKEDEVWAGVLAGVSLFWERAGDGWQLPCSHRQGLKTVRMKLPNEQLVAHSLWKEEWLG